MDLKEANYRTINHFLFFNIWWHLSPGTITAFIFPPYTLQHNSSMTVPSIPWHRPRKACDRWPSKRCEAVRMIESEGVSVCQQAGSINLCADTVQAAFLCKAATKGLSRNSVDSQKENCIQASQAGPSISRKWYWTFRAWTPLLAGPGFNQLWSKIRHDYLCECGSLWASAGLFRFLPTSWDIPMMRKLWYAWINDHIRDYWCLSSAHTMNLKLIVLSARVTFWAFHGKKHRRLTRFCERLFQLQKHLKCCIQIV